MSEVLRSITVLIVEDEAIIAFDMKATLVEAGAAVIGPVRSVAAAFQAIGTGGVSAAVLDVRLGSDAVWPVADELEKKGIPFIFHTAHAEKDMVKSGWPGRLILQKPATSRQLVNAIAGLLKH